MKRGRPRFELSAEKRGALAERFFAACESGDLEALLRLLAADATFQGATAAARRSAALRVMVPGSRRHHRPSAAGTCWAPRRHGPYGGFPQAVRVNGYPGLLLHVGGRLPETFAFEPFDEHGDDRGPSIDHALANPDKLAHLGPTSDMALRPPPKRERPDLWSIRVTSCRFRAPWISV